MEKIQVSDPDLGINWFEYFEAKFGAITFQDARVVVMDGNVDVDSTNFAIMKLAQYLNRFEHGIDNAKPFLYDVRMYEDWEFQDDFKHEMRQHSWRPW